jgi:hypothetical protein
MMEQREVSGLPSEWPEGTHLSGEAGVRHSPIRPSANVCTLDLDVGLTWFAGPVADRVESDCARS